MNKTITVESVLIDLKEELFNNEIVKEYFRLKEIISNSDEIKSVLDNVSKYQKEMASAFPSSEEYKKSREQYLFWKNKYDNYPVVVNYNEVKKEVYNLLKEVQTIVSEK